jgi:TolB protein
VSRNSIEPWTILGIVFMAVTGAVCALVVSAAAHSSQSERQGVIAYEGSDGLYVVEANGGAARKIPGTKPRDGDPAWSPDGHSIAFDRGGNRPRDIYVADADGSNERRLTYAPWDDAYPQWSPNGQSIAFMSERILIRDIYAIDVARDQARRVSRHGLYPDWRLNRRILFADYNGDLMSVLPYGADNRRLARATSKYGFIAARISDDDLMLVLTDLGLHPAHRLYTARADGSDPKLVLRTPLEIFNPSWSPDGQWITFSAGPSEAELNVYVIRTDGAEMTQLTHATYACCSDWRSP